MVIAMKAHREAGITVSHAPLSTVMSISTHSSGDWTMLIVAPAFFVSVLIPGGRTV